jgi:phage/plasmid-associated DNA primase
LFADLFNSWKTWCEAMGEYAGSSKNFSQKLSDLGYTFERRVEGRGFRGLTLDRYYKDAHGEERATTIWHPPHNP